MLIARTIAAAALITALAAASVEAAKPQPPMPLMGPAPGAIVGARQGSMIMAANVLNTVERALKANAPAKSVAFPLSGLAKWAEHIPSQFAPNTSAVPGTRAKPEVWSNRQDFLNQATDMALAADMMLSAARADDSAALGTALENARAACKGCHDKFQAPPPAASAG